MKITTRCFMFCLVVLLFASTAAEAQLTGKTCAYITKTTASNYAQDAFVKAKLAEWGVAVTEYPTQTTILTAVITDAIRAELKAKDFIFISEVVSSSDLAQMRAFDQRIVASDGWIAKQASLGFVVGGTQAQTYDNILGPGATGTSGVAGTGEVTFVDNTGSSLAGGFSQGNTVAITSGSGANTGEVLNYTVPQVTPIIPIAVTKEAYTASNFTKLVLYGIEPGTMVFPATGTTANIPLTKRFAAWNVHANGFGIVTTDGWNLLKAAITWVLTPSTSVGQSETMPSDFVLQQNYPNPFNPSTEIAFNLPKEGMTTLSVFNVLGQKVATLVNQNLNAGAHHYTFDASKMNSGVYFYRLESGSTSFTKKMMLVK